MVLVLELGHLLGGLVADYLLDWGSVISPSGPQLSLRFDNARKGQQPHHQGKY